LTSDMAEDTFALYDGEQIFTFSVEDAPRITDMLDAQWPRCKLCSARGCGSSCGHLEGGA